ncbi:helix-turn-helix domain-containing protein [Tissierella sp. P1]|uniref:helix-turn-helix domain-containing protein n=2 Tax=Tissierellaceae TaxID=1737406 RepID=UPI001F216ED2|nr:helix-turn-helix domain-containing protein [Tissierella sp. P1]
MNRASYIVGDPDDIPLLKDVVLVAEKEAIEKALVLTKGNKSLAAEKLGIHRTALYKKIDKYKIES